MKRFLIYIFALTAAYSLSGQEKKVDQNFRTYFYDQRRSFFEAMPDTENEIIMLGNSITNGASWDEIFPDLNIKNRGISGDITLGVLDRMDEVLSSKPCKIFILIGINDIARGIPNDTIVENYKAIVKRIKTESPSTRIYIESLMPTNDEFSDFKNHQGKMPEIKDLNEKLKLYASEQEIEFINLFDSFLDENGKLNKKYTNDGLHLLGEGYMHWYSILKKYIYE